MQALEANGSGGLYVDNFELVGSAGPLLVSVVAQSSSVPLHPIHFGSPSNGLIDAAGLVGFAGNRSITLPVGTMQTSFCTASSNSLRT